jgi:CcmD family protein
MSKVLRLFAALVALTPAVAFAQYERVEGQVRESIPAAPYLAAAYGVIWTAVLVYVISLARRLARTRSEIEELRRKIDRG